MIFGKRKRASVYRRYFHRVGKDRVESSRIDSESWLDGRSSEISERERERRRRKGEKRIESVELEG